MGDLLFERVGVGAVADGRAQQQRQRARHLHDLRIASGVAHPDNRVERVVKKMRLDLRLQRLPFALALLFLAAQTLVHELCGLGDHVVKAVRQLAKLRAGGYLAAHVQIAVLHAPHRLHQTADGSCDGARELKREHQRKNERRRRDEQIGLVDPVLTAQQLLRVGNAHRRPSGGLRCAGYIEPAHPALAGERAAVRCCQHLRDVFLLQSRIDQILLRVPEDAAALVDQIDIAPAAELDIRAEPVDDLVVKVDEQNALHIPCAVEHGLGERNDPVVLARDQVFHARGGNLYLVRFLQRGLVPVCILVIGICVERRTLASEQRAAGFRDQGDGRDLRADLLCGGQLFLRFAAGRVRQPVLVGRAQIGRDRAVVDNKIRNILHVLHVHIKLGVDAADQLLGVLRRAVQQLVRQDADRHIGHGCRNDEDQQHEQRRDPRADGVPGKKSCFGHVPLSASLYCRGVMPVLRRKVSEK